MAEGPPEDKGTGNWWDSWYQAAKEKSTAALELVKKDLSEFTCTVRSDTGNAVAATSETLQGTAQPDRTAPAVGMVKSGITSFLDGITRALTIPPDDGPVDELTVRPGGEISYDRGQARLSAIQLDPGTYCSQPSGPPEQFEMWKENFDLESKKGEISEMLVSRVEVRALYTKLVPAEVSHSDFWARYFYKVHQLQLDEARKVALMRRAEATRDDSFSWDDEEDCSSDSESSNEVIDLSPNRAFTPVKPQQQPPANNVDQSKTEKVTMETKGPNQTATSDPIQTPLDTKKETVLKNTEKTPVETDLKNSEKTPVEMDLKKAEKTPVETDLKNVEKTPIETDLKNTEKTPVETDSAIDLSNKNSIQTIPAESVTQSPQSAISSENKSTPSSTDKPTLTSDNKTVSKESEVSQSIPTTKIDSSVESQLQKDVPESADSKADYKLLKEIKTREKGDMVVVGSGSSSPISEESANVKKDVGSAEATDEDWDEDFDLELTEEDIRLAEEAAKKYKSPETLEDLDIMEDDWNWD